MRSIIFNEPTIERQLIGLKCAEAIGDGGCEIAIDVVSDALHFGLQVRSQSARVVARSNCSSIAAINDLVTALGDSSGELREAIVDALARHAALLNKNKLTDVLQKIMLQNFAFLNENPTFLVQFDRGDVAWLRAYCHFLAGVLDTCLALDFELVFDIYANDLFENPEFGFQGNFEQKLSATAKAMRMVVISEPKSLNSARLHVLQVARLNHEIWRHIRAEEDDEFEWLPNSRQSGVLGLSVRDELVDSWLNMMDELAALLEGERTLPAFLSIYGGLNLKTLAVSPPEYFLLDRRLPDQYYSDERDVDI